VRGGAREQRIEEAPQRGVVAEMVGQQPGRLVGVDGAGAPGGASTHQRVREGTMALNALRPLLEEAHQQFWQRSRGRVAELVEIGVAASPTG